MILINTINKMASVTLSTSLRTPLKHLWKRSNAYIIWRLASMKWSFSLKSWQDDVTQSWLTSCWFLTSYCVSDTSCHNLVYSWCNFMMTTCIQVIWKCQLISITRICSTIYNKTRVYIQYIGSSVLYKQIICLELPSNKPTAAINSNVFSLWWTFSIVCPWEDSSISASFTLVWCVTLKLFTFW